MGSGTGAGASALSALSPLFGAYASVKKGEGAKAADEMQADRLTRAAEFGRVQADLTDTTMREQLNTTLGNIDVIRAAARIDPTSPTTAALEDRQKQISTRERSAAGLSIRSQVAENEDSAAYLRKAGEFALLQGYIEGGTKIGAAVGKSFPGRASG